MFKMAVPKKRKSRSKRDMRRSHDHVKMPSVTECPQCHEPVKGRLRFEPRQKLNHGQFTPVISVFRADDPIFTCTTHRQSPGTAGLTRPPARRGGNSTDAWDGATLPAPGSG